MLHQMGFYSSPHFDNLTLLNRLVDHDDSRIATAVLTSPVAGDDLIDKALTRADLSNETVEEVKPQAIMRHLKPRHQLALLRAAGHSRAAASTLAAHAAPETLATILREVRPGAFAGASNLLSAVNNALSERWYARFNDQPGYRELLEHAVAARGGPAADTVPADMLLNWLAGHPVNELPAALTRIGAQEPGTPASLVDHADAILCLTIGQPDIARDLAGTGDLGVLVLARDHRQDPALLASLTVADDRFAEELRLSLTRNPAAPTATLADLVAHAHAALDTAADTEHLLTVLNGLTSSVNRVLSHAEQPELERVRTSLLTAHLTPDERNEANYLCDRPLLWLEVAANPTTNVTLDEWSMRHLHVALPGTVRARIGLPYQAPDPEPQATGDEVWIRDWRFDHRVQRKAAGWLARRVTTATQLHQICLATFRHRRSRLSMVVDQVVAEHPDIETPPAAGFDDLLGNPLG